LKARNGKVQITAFAEYRKRQKEDCRRSGTVLCVILRSILLLIRGVS